MRILGWVVVFALAGSAFAGKAQGDVQNGAVKGGGQSKSVSTAEAAAAAYSASASKSSARQRQQQAQVQGQSQTALGNVKTDSHDRYEAAKIPVNTAAELPTGFCAGSGASLQTSYVGISGTDRDYVCARIELFRAYQDAELGLARVLAAIETEQSAKGVQAGAVAEATVRELAQSVHADAIRQLKAADERLGEDDTKTRGFFVKVLGSLPRPLQWLAPR